jgi:hypothetical protein
MRVLLKRLHDHPRYLEDQGLVRILESEPPGDQDACYAAPACPERVQVLHDLGEIGILVQPEIERPERFDERLPDEARF